MTALATLEVLVVDCQTSGATPAHGDLLELGWGSVGPAGVRLEATFVRPATDRPISAQVRKLTGWSPAVLGESIDPLAAWRRLLAHVPATRPVPTAIHFARFELAFLRDLHARSAEHASPFPLDIVCIHAAAARLFPDLPRRNLRALAGMLGHSPELLRQARGHVEATAFLWSALVPRLADIGVTTWQGLKDWLEAPAEQKRGRGRAFPLEATARRALPDAPGVYRFVRPNGDVLYVGKAASVKKRVASHFTSGARAASSRERSLEMLSQVDHVDVTPAATILEAALLEVDEIKRLDPPYNRQLRAGDRSAWFATTDWNGAAPEPTARHRVGPLPSMRSLDGIAAIRALALGAEPTEERRAAAVGVPPFFAPPEELFVPAWRDFFTRELYRSPAPLRTRILDASRRIVVREREDEAEEAPPTWDEDTVRRYLERTVVGQGLLVRRARLLGLLADAVVVFREPGASAARLLVLRAGVVVDRADVPTLDAPGPSGEHRPPPRGERLAGFDAARYDRLRVLTTELRRVGAFEVRVGRHVIRNPPTAAGSPTGQKTE